MPKASVKVELWDRQDGETMKQFQAFCVYRDMGNERSVRKAAQELNKSSTLIAKWSSLNKWVERVAAYDLELERISRIEQQKEIAKMRNKHANIASAMLVTAANALREIKPSEVKPSDISRMVEVASKLERISRGDVGEVVEERQSDEPATPAVQFYIPDNNRN